MTDDRVQEAHELAVAAGESSYLDPDTGFLVLTGISDSRPRRKIAWACTRRF